ncbi:MAG: hypothetical protein ACI9DQ_001609 [Glaciecola sp.]|jgi:hypothetical protein
MLRQSSHQSSHQTGALDVIKTRQRPFILPILNEQRLRATLHLAAICSTTTLTQLMEVAIPLGTAVMALCIALWPT